MKQCCKTCRLFALEQAQDKAGRAIFPARCNWVSTEVWPDSVIRPYGNRRPNPSLVMGKNGTKCPCWEPRQ